MILLATKRSPFAPTGRRRQDQPDPPWHGAAKLLLGHVSTDTTEIYLLDEVKESMKVAKQLDASQEPEEGVETPVEES